MSSSAPIRVVTMVDSLLAGGAERVAVELACGLDRRRFQPHVLVTRGDGPLRSLLEDADVPYTMLERGRALDIGAWRRARRLVRREADVLHAHKFGSNAWAALLARLTGVPLIAHEHNFSEAPSPSRAFIERRWVATRAYRIVCVSESVADVERASGVPDSRIEVVPNGVRLDAAWSRERARAELGLADTSSVTIGIVGRLREEKAHDVLLDAVAASAQSGRNVRLCVVGDGPCKTQLQLRAAQLGIDGRVVWAGERRDAATLARAFDISVICSHWEGLPLAALEALAAGVPLIATRVGGLPALLEDGAGQLVAPGQASELSTAINALVDHPEARAALGAAGARRVADRYSFAHMVSRIEGLYEAAVRPHGAHAAPSLAQKEHAA